MVEKILNNTIPYGKIRASHEGSLHSSTLKGNVDEFCNDLHCTHECVNADRPPLKRNQPIGYHELQVS